jgi:transcriptional regulator with XRE-family HTH domain
MPSDAIEIGLEIRLLRERKKVSGKELAERIGLSQSQMSRLEKGQRRIDTKLLNKIAEALDVKPSYFFEGGEPDLVDVDLRHVNRDIGKLVRTERHRLHLTPDELGSRIGKTRSYVRAIEEGEIDVLSNEMVGRISKALKMNSAQFFEAQQRIINSLKRQVARLSQAHAETTLGRIPTTEIDSGEGETRKAVPIIGSMAGGYPQEFSADGMPVDDVDDFVFVSRLDDEKAFALYCVGDYMESGSSPSFTEGDILVFSPKLQVSNRDFVFARTERQKPMFRQIIFDPNAWIRLQPLNLSYPPIICNREELVSAFRLAAAVRKY